MSAQIRTADSLAELKCQIKEDLLATRDSLKPFSTNTWLRSLISGTPQRPIMFLMFGCEWGFSRQSRRFLVTVSLGC